MRFQVTEAITVVADKDNNVYVTRPNMQGRIVTHNVGYEYTPLQVATWLKMRHNGDRCKLIQDEFPNMSAENREFLITGITPQEWKEMFSGEDD